MFSEIADFCIKNFSDNITTDYCGCINDKTIKCHSKTHISLTRKIRRVFLSNADTLCFLIQPINSENFFD